MRPKTCHLPEIEHHYLFMPGQHDNYKFFVFQVIYNAFGEVLMPVVIHNGCISETLHCHFQDRLGFMENESICLDYNTLGGCMQLVYESVQILNIFLLHGCIP